MFSQTTLVFAVEDFTAEIAMRCAYCSHGEINIAEGEKLFYIEGYRTYTRMYKELVSGQGFAESMIPYVPWEARQRLEGRVNPRTFTDPITQHRMCQKCFCKFRRFMILSFGCHLPESGNIEIKTKPFFMTNPCSMPARTYSCNCCPAIIDGNTSYLRVGYIDTICASCAEIISGVIGTEYSY